MKKDKATLIPSDYGAFLTAVKERVRNAQYAALKAVNTELVGLYWDIGRMIVERQSGETWGKAVVLQLAVDLQAEFPGLAGFSTSNLWYMRQLYSEYRPHEKLQPLVGEIGWAHNLAILSKCKDPLEREFYLRMTRKFGWSKSVLIHQIENQSYEKSLLGQTNFDRALIAKIEKFLRAMGGMFAFMGSQFRLEVEGDEYFIDLLLFHRRLRCLVAIDLKIGSFKPEFVGKMQFYLTGLDRLVRQEDENPSIGIILCKDKKRTVVEYALHDAHKPIGVATYQMRKTLPKNLAGHLPSPETIAALLNSIEEEEAP